MRDIINAMSGSITTHSTNLSNELKRHHERLEAGCRKYGLTVSMFRTAKYLYHVATLLFAVYLIELTTISTPVAVGVAVLLIAGPEGVEGYLVRQGVIDGEDTDGDT